mmetsp:Transcript_83939/g.166611  ORF Transcript_83939/g.166611 Transcript_83939/m.166611 type:complete len:102 (-) Transcript_83939:20-325(-)
MSKIIATKLKKQPVIMTCFRARSAQTNPTLPKVMQQRLCSMKGASFINFGAAGRVNSFETCLKQDLSLLSVGAQKPPQKGTFQRKNCFEDGSQQPTMAKQL